MGTVLLLTVGGLTMAYYCDRYYNDRYNSKSVSQLSFNYQPCGLECIYIEFSECYQKGSFYIECPFSFPLSSNLKHHKAGVALGVITIVTGVVFLVDLLLSLRH